MSRSELPAQLRGAKAKIKAAFINGVVMTSDEGNEIGKTVDARKVISVLRREGMNIKDYWDTNLLDKRRFKRYYLEQGKTSSS